MFFRIEKKMAAYHVIPARITIFYNFELFDFKRRKTGMKTRQFSTMKRQYELDAWGHTNNEGIWGTISLLNGQ